MTCPDGKFDGRLFPTDYSLLRRPSLGSSPNIPPPRTSAEANGTFLSLCSKRSAGEHVEITEEPIAGEEYCVTSPKSVCVGGYIDYRIK